MAVIKINIQRLRDLWSVSNGDIDNLAKALGVKPSYANQKILGHKAWFADEMNVLADQINGAGMATVTPAQCISIIGADKVKVRGTLADGKGGGK